MKRIFHVLAFLFALSVPIAAKADNGVVTITVTNVAANITVDRDCNFVVIRENAATPTAVFDITLAGSATAHHYAAGTQFIFAAPKGAGGPPLGGWRFTAGSVIGTIVATTAGPFSFTGDESFGEPSLAAKNGTGAGAAATDANLSVSDVTTNNVSTSAHGFVPKAPNDATKYLDGTGAYSTPASAAVSGTPVSVTNPVFGSDTGGWGGYTLTCKVPGISLVSYPASWVAKFYYAAGSPVIGAMAVKKTLAGSTTVLTSVTLTVGGIANPTLTTPHQVVTDTVSMQLDNTHDYYLELFQPANGANNSTGLNNPATGSAFLSCNYAFGDQTSASTVPGVGGAPYLWLGIFNP